MSEYTRRQIEELTRKVRPGFYDLIRNGNVVGFRHLLDIYCPGDALKNRN